MMKLCLLSFLLIFGANVFLNGIYASKWDDSYKKYLLNSVSTGRNEPRILRVMAFNIWNNGRNVKQGIQKIAKQIETAKPDVVALQEVEDGLLQPILDLLGPEWRGIPKNDSGGDYYPDTAVLSRLPLDEDSYADFEKGMGLTVQVPLSQVQWAKVHFWSVHLDWQDYGPYAACNRLTTEVSQLEVGEYNPCDPDHSTRVRNIKDLLANPAFQEQIAAKSDREPVLVLGDFNCPSHEDWTQETQQAHCGWSFKWPATKLLADVGFRDAYRIVHPNPAIYPGTTWSTTHKSWVPSTGTRFGYTIPEPQDRIDMIWFKGRGLEPISATEFHGAGFLRPAPHYEENDWPSDHSAVLAEFRIFP